MLTISHNSMVYLYSPTIDMRLGMYRLQGRICSQYAAALRKGAYFIFSNKPRTLVKIVWFDGTGLCLMSKRLEKGSFSWADSAASEPATWMQIEPSAASLLLDGIELKNCMRKAWYER